MRLGEQGRDAVLGPLYAHAVAWAGAELDWFDAHTHIGANDPDGQKATPADLLDAMDVAGHRRALVFPMHEPSGYGAANDAVLAAAGASGGRLTALARVDPNAHGAVAEARRCLDAGAAGIKLHPRSDRFALSHPAVESVVALAAQRRAVVLFHAGRGIPMLGEHAIDLARRYPDVHVILAHAGISDLGVVAPAARELGNLLFDTSWWQPSDVLTLFTTIPPGRIVYGSDMPYGPPRFTGAVALRCARVAGLSPDVMREIAGGQLERVLSGRPAADLGPAPGPGALGERVLAFERALAYLSTAVQTIYRGGDPEEALALARLGCQSPADGDPSHAAVLAAIDELTARAQEAIAASSDPFAGAMAALSACLVAGTPGAGPPGAG